MSDYKEISYTNWHTKEPGLSKINPEHYDEFIKYEWFYDDAGVFKLEGPNKIYIHNEVFRICLENGYSIDKRGHLVAPIPQEGLII